MFEITNILLTRRCNLKCKYCNIVKDPEAKEYPPISYYLENELPPETWFNIISKIKELNEKAFFVIYGGEPYMYGPDKIRNLTKLMNHNSIYYTYVSNCSTDTIKQFWMNLHEDIGLSGFTGSVDPISKKIKQEDRDRYLKSKEGIEFLGQMVDIGVPDVVAEVVVDKTNLHDLPYTITELTKRGVWASVSTMEVARNKFYDFSVPMNIDESKKYLLNPEETQKLLNIVSEMYYEGYLIHGLQGLMKVLTRPDGKVGTMQYSGPPDLNTITIDSDGSFRLCYRIRGISTPLLFAYHSDPKMKTLLNSEDIQIFLDQLSMSMFSDYENFCEGCSWTCRGFSTSCKFEEITHVKEE